MYQFIYCERNKQHIFDVSKSLSALRRVMFALQELVRLNKRILFIGNNEITKRVVERNALECDELFLTSPSNCGILSKFYENRKRWCQDEKIPFKKGTEREILSKIRKIAFYRYFEHPPDFIVLLNRKGNDYLINEARIMNVPVACLCDSDDNPTDIDYVIPGNVNLSRSVNFFMNMMSKAIIDIKEQIRQREEKIGRKSAEQIHFEENEHRKEILDRIQVSKKFSKYQLLHPEEFVDNFEARKNVLNPILKLKTRMQKME